MKNVLAFFRVSGDSQLEREFRRVYQEPSIPYLRIAFLLGVVAFAGFYLMDALAGRLDAGSLVSKVRVGLIAIFGMGALLIDRYRPFVVRFYVVVVNLFCFLGIQATGLFPLVVHRTHTSAEFYWSLNISLVTGIVVIYGFSRLTARNTALVVLSGCVTGAVTAFFGPLYDPYYLGRLVLHLVVVTAVSFSLRQSVEQRERQLFLLAKENLLRNVYAKDLEVAKSRVEEANDVKMRFLSNMSHAFRTPMHGVIQTLELVSRTATAETGRLVSRALASSNAFLDTINSILNYTRWSQPNEPTKASSVSLVGAARAIADRYAQAIAERGLDFQLRLDLTAHNERVLIDAVMLEEIVGNVLGNAVKFTTSGRIDFGVELKRSEKVNSEFVIVDIVIADTGIGIPVDQQPLVCTAFYQGDSGSDRAQGGTGLGLAVADRLVAAMGGSMTFSSAVGVGTTFRIGLPARLSLRTDSWEETGDRWTGPPADAKPRAHGQPSLTGSVLLVEDNELNAALAKELLELNGLDVVLVADGVQAEAAARQTRFDVILMDCQMPVMDGYEATRAIRQSERVRDVERVPVIAITANAMAGDRDKCLDAGMDDYLAKPYRAAQLRAKLALWLPELSTTSTGVVTSDS